MSLARKLKCNRILWSTAIFDVFRLQVVMTMQLALKPILKPLTSSELRTYRATVRGLSSDVPGCTHSTGVTEMWPNALRFSHPKTPLSTDWVEHEGFVVLDSVLDALRPLADDTVSFVPWSRWDSLDFGFF